MNKLDSVAIIGLGQSSIRYLSDFIRNGYKRHTDEVWTINHGGYFWKDIDLIIAMDDMRWKAKEVGYEGYIDLLAKQGMPILTSTKYPEYKNAIEFPKSVIKEYGLVMSEKKYWLINSCAYAIAYALSKNVEHLHLYGFDFKVRPQVSIIKEGDPHWRRFHLPENLPLYTEPGEANVMYLLGVANERGVTINVANGSTLFDNDIPPYLYGYLND